MCNDNFDGMSWKAVLKFSVFELLNAHVCAIFHDDIPVVCIKLFRNILVNARILT